MQDSECIEMRGSDKEGTDARRRQTSARLCEEEENERKIMKSWIPSA